MNNNYRPIDCSFHDHLEASASLKKCVCLEFFLENGQLKNTKAVIDNIYAKEGEEYLSLDNGETVRLDRITKLNNLVFPGHSCIR